MELYVKSNDSTVSSKEGVCQRKPEGKKHNENTLSVLCALSVSGWSVATLL